MDLRPISDETAIVEICKLKRGKTYEKSKEKIAIQDQEPVCR